MINQKLNLQIYQQSVSCVDKSISKDKRFLHAYHKRRAEQRPGSSHCKMYGILVILNNYESLVF